MIQATQGRSHGKMQAKSDPLKLMMPKRRPLQVCALLLAILPLSALAACEVTEQQILGAWTRVTKQGFFEDMAFEVDGRIRSFSSWLHQRPEIMDASWVFENCRLSIEDKDDKHLSFVFWVAVNKKGQLELKDEKEAVASRYKRVP